MKWVKASEVPDPGLSKYYIVKTDTHAGRCYCGDKYAMSRYCIEHEISMDDLLWLDESTPPVSAMEDGWTEIKEGCDMPSDNEDCLVWTELATKWQASTFNNKRFYRYSNAVESDRMALYYFPDVVKWMPLPPPPSK